MTDVMSIRLQGRVLIRSMEAAAERLECDPRQLAVALLVIVFRFDLVDGILDGDDPKGYAPHYAMTAPRNQLGPRQGLFMDWFRKRIAGRDRTEFSYKTAAQELTWDEGSLGAVVRSLLVRGDLVQIKPGTRGRPGIWALPIHKNQGDAA